MNNKIIIGIIIVVLIAVGFFLFKGSDSGDENTEVASNSEAANNNENETERGEKSIRDLMLAGSPLKCEVSNDVEGVPSSGTVHLSNGKMQGSFSSEINGQIMRSNVISDTEYVYTWTEGSNQGYKMKVSETTQTQADTNSNQTDLDEIFNFECERWAEDGSMFNPPGSVTFSDYSQMMMQPGSTNSSDANDAKAMQCAACDSLSGDSKAQCLAALSCS